MALVLPYTFTAGTIADATQVNADFAAVAGYVNTNINTTLQGPTTFYVSPSGADLPNNGLSPNTPTATISYTLHLIRNAYDVNAQFVTIQLANGIYNEEVDHSGAITGLTGAAALVVQGNVGSPASVVWNGGPNACLNCANGALITVQGVTMQNPSANCIIAQNHARVFFNTVVFGACAGSHLVSARAAALNANGNYSITGGAARHAFAVESGELYIDVEPSNFMTFTPGSPTVTITGTPAFTGQFADAANLSLIKFGAVFSGSATGVRYNAALNSTIATYNQGPNYLPGDTAGTTSTGGQYF